MKRTPDWDEHIQEEDLQPYLSDLPPTQAGQVLHNYLENQADIPGTQWEGNILDGENLIGRYDCYDEQDGVVYEFKSKSENGMNRAPYQEDIKQVEKYLDALNEDIGFLVYVERENLDIQEYPVMN